MSIQTMSDDGELEEAEDAEYGDSDMYTDIDDYGDGNADMME